ncbi:MAG: ADP-ribosyltransferase [Chitinispirillia bacterium]|nr:ADP-ribosyltransferase [Chitinispirillia bacterium]
MERFQRQSDEAYAKFTETERSATGDYTRAAYLGINEALFDGTWDKKTRIANYVHDVDSAIGKFSLKEDVVVYRGTASEYFVGWGVGSIKPYDAYMSTSFSKEVAQGFADNRAAGGRDSMMIEIEIPRGTRGLYIGSNSNVGVDEAEFLVGRGQKFRVKERTNNFMKLEVVHD